MVRQKYISVGHSTSYEGHNYGTKLEASCARKLDRMVKAGHVVKWERQHYIHIPKPKRHPFKPQAYRKHKVDFLAYLPDGSKLLIEAKGKRTEWYSKMYHLITTVYLPQNLDTEYEIWVDSRSRYWALRNSLRRH